MAESSSSGLGSAPVATPGLLSPVPRSLNAKEEKREEYEISEGTFNRKGLYEVGGNRNSYESSRILKLPAGTESLYSGSSSGVYESAPRQLSLVQQRGIDTYRTAA